MEGYSLLTTLVTGVVATFAMFFTFYKGVKWTGKMSAAVTILITQAIYIPLAALHWSGLDVFAIHFAFFTMSAYGLGIITSQRDARHRREGEKTDQGWFHWAPATIVGFFLVLAIVDATIITLATKGADSSFMERFLPDPKSGHQVASTFPGSVSHDYQEKYDQFNSYVAQLQEQRERGWQIKDGWAKSPMLGQAATFKIRVLDRAEAPVTGAQVTVDFQRPASRSKDKKLVLPEVGDGYYGMDVTLTEPGLWNVVLLVERGEERHEIRGETVVALPE